MKLREILIEKIVEFEISSGKKVVSDSIIKMSDEELLYRYRINVYDEGYADGHYDGYLEGVHENE